MVVPSTAEKFPRTGTIRFDEPEVEVPIAVAGENDPFPGRRPIAHGVGPIPLRQAMDAAAVPLGNVEVLGPAATGAKNELLAIGRARQPTVVAAIGDQGFDF